MAGRLLGQGRAGAVPPGAARVLRAVRRAGAGAQRRVFEASAFAGPAEVSRTTIANYLAALEVTKVAHAVSGPTRATARASWCAPRRSTASTPASCEPSAGWGEMRQDDLGQLLEHYVLPAPRTGGPSTSGTGGRPTTRRSTSSSCAGAWRPSPWNASGGRTVEERICGLRRSGARIRTARASSWRATSIEPSTASCSPGRGCDTWHWTSWSAASRESWGWSIRPSPPGAPASRAPSTARGGTPLTRTCRSAAPCPRRPRRGRRRVGARPPAPPPRRRRAAA